MPVDLGTTVAGVHLGFPAMNTPGSATRPEELRALAASRAGAIVLRTATQHPFVHPEFRSLHTPGFDKLVPLARELAAGCDKPVIASVAGSSGDEYATVGRAFAEAGAALVEANVAETWVDTTAAPFEAPGRLRELLERLVRECPVPVTVRLPDRMRIGHAAVADELAAIGVRVVVIRNDFTRFEKFLLETGATFEVIAVGGIAYGWDLQRTLAKGARAVQIGDVLVGEGPRVFARLERELRRARGERDVT